MNERALPLGRWLLLLLALRLVTWALLEPPWGAFDEPYHQGYVEVCSDSPGWHRFLSVALPQRLVGAMRNWPIYEGYANAFQARTYGETSPRTPREVFEPNYETLQSPTYYIVTGLFLRVLPRLDPIAELYLLRLLNALLAFLVSLLCLSAARLLGFGRRAWLPVAFLAFIPGYAIALVRVSNDALCALFVSATVALSLREMSQRGGRDLAGAALAGFSPWTKLYALATLPAWAWRCAREREALARFAGLSLIFAPGALLAFFSHRLNGEAISMLEVLKHPRPVRLRDVPWLQDGWTIAKTHLWISGMSDIVFPTLIYVVLALALVSLFALSFVVVKREGSSENHRQLLMLACPLAFFVVALAYFSWKNFAFYQGPGGTGGWYLWAMALPEVLLLSWGAVRRPAIARFLPILFAAFLAVAAAGDLTLILESTGRLRVTPGDHHVLGLTPASLTALATALLQSRPAFVATAGALLALCSWIAGVLCLVQVRRSLGDPRL